MDLSQNVSDYRSLFIWKKYLRQCSDGVKKLLRGMLHCGDTAVPVHNAVFVVQTVNEDKSVTSDYKHVLRCHSPWSCPYCAARVMTERAHQIAAAIEALDKIYHQSATMITFTIPHTKNMTCADTFEILKATWRRFTHAGTNKSLKTHTHKDGSIYTYTSTRGVYCKMRSELGSVHNVRVYEFTYGENSWHPHIHALYWFPEENFDKVVDYEDEMAKHWFACAREQSLKYWSRKWNDKEKAAAYVDSLFSYDGKPNSRGYYGLTISKTSDGKPRKIESSYYVSGWTGDKELTNMRTKKAHTGHYSVFQLLEEAKAAKTWEEACTWLSLYTEYAYATKGARRVFFSARTGIHEIIKQWRDREKETIIKKKDTHPTRKVVFWFTNEEWFTISCFEIIYKIDVRSTILEKARLPDATKQIENALKSFGLNIKAKPRHRFQDVFEVAA